MSTETLPPGVTVMRMDHDPWCRAQHTQRTSDCICNPELVPSSLADLAATHERMNRAQRRAAERQARRARKS
jgi:hypothetical protein